MSDDTSGDLFRTLYAELHELASLRMRGEAAGHTLQPTALVNEVYLKLHRGSPLDFQNRAHFLATAARAMRNVLIDHARRRRADKRGGDAVRVPLAETCDPAPSAQPPGAEDPEYALVEIDEALSKLARLDEPAASVVVMWLYGGMTQEEIAAVMGVTGRTVRNHWSIARAWLRRELGERKE